MVDAPDIPNAIIVLCALLLAFGVLVVVMVLYKHLAPCNVDFSEFFPGYKRLKRDSAERLLSDYGEEHPLEPGAETKNDSWLERLVTILVFFSADDINDADLIIPISEAEKLGTVEI
jgi:hypothetical protein